MAEEALEKMLEIAPGMNLYLHNLRTNLPKFSYSTKGNYLTLGFNTTSPSESCNKMIKTYLPAKTLNLREIRSYISTAFEFKKKSKPMEFYRYTTNQLKLRELINVPISPNIFKRIENEYEHTKDLSLSFSDNYVHCIDGDHVYKISNSGSECSCGFTACNGLPCRHLIFFHHRVTGNFPSYLIHQRWYTEEIQPPPVEQIIFCDTMSDFDSDSDYDSDFVPEDEYSSESYMLSNDELLDLDCNADNMNIFPLETSKKKYTELFYKGKELARLGSINDEWYKLINEDFENMLCQLTSETKERTTTEQMTISRRGRPRKSGYSKGPDPKESGCPICEKKHALKKCKYYGVLLDNVKKYKGKKKGKMRCPICGYFDHPLNKCTPLIQTKLMVNDRKEIK